MTATTDMNAFWDAWPLFQDSVLTGTLAGILLGFLGVYIVLGRMVFLSAALSQVAGFGVTLAYAAQAYFGVAAIVASPTMGASILSISCLGLIWSNRESDRTHRDSMLGLIFLVGSAGTLMVASKIVEELHDVQTLLFGSSVAVLPEDFQTVLIFGVLILGLHLWWWRGFVEVTYDESTSEVRGMPVQALKFILMLTIALSVSVCTRVLGALPSFAFSVFPAMAAIGLASNIPRAMILAAGVGGGCGFFGYVLAFLYDFPVGPSQTMVGVFLWGLAVFVSKFLKQRS
ncbi:MAG: metal ABC transporter permease [Myxococcota bacterium]|nr:metal ABC transporter permease [Myxococcota bacterium]